MQGITQSTHFFAQTVLDQCDLGCREPTSIAANALGRGGLAQKTVVNAFRPDTLYIEVAAIELQHPGFEVQVQKSTYLFKSSLRMSSEFLVADTDDLVRRIGRFLQQMPQEMTNLSRRPHQVSSVRPVTSPTLIVGRKDVARVAYADQDFGFGEQVVDLREPQHVSGSLLTPAGCATGLGIGTPEGLEDRPHRAGITGTPGRLFGKHASRRIPVVAQGLPN